MMLEGLEQAVADLIEAAGFHVDFSLHLLTGGANNRVFRVEMGGSRALLKVYFRHPHDKRDRLGAEFSFSSFAWRNGLRCLPQPFSCDPENGLGLYEFVEGCRPLPCEIKESMVREALNFYRELNYHKHLPDAAALPIASEACFTIAEHLYCVERRLQRLRHIDDSSPINREAAVFVQNELSKAWSSVADFIHREAHETGLRLGAEIAQRDRCLSPSDFGFHNTILAYDGRLCFIDFEYAGWDDPAKMICDFFCQPAVPVPMDYYNMFVDTIVSDLSEPEVHLQRIALLLPVYRIKWCCILLNDFLPVGLARRRFARRDVDLDARRVKQLQKARHCLQSLA